VNPETASVLHALLVAKEGTTTCTIGKATGLDRVATDGLLAALAVVGLVESTAPGRWRPDPLLRHPEAQGTVTALLALLSGELTPDAPPLQPESLRPLMPLGAAARALGVSVDSLTDWARRGLVPFTWTAGGHRRFDVPAIRDLLERRAA